MFFHLGSKLALLLFDKKPKKSCVSLSNIISSHPLLFEHLTKIDNFEISYNYKLEKSPLIRFGKRL